MSKKLYKTAFLDELTKVSNPGKFFKKNRSKMELSGSWADSLVPGWSELAINPMLGGMRKAILIGVVIIAFFGLFLRLFHLQVIHGFENRDLADTNRIQIKIIHAPRGVIYDRNGKVLAQNEPGFR